MADHESGRGRTQAGTRARDVDRVTSMQILDDALLDGQLSIGEHRQRVEDAKSASILANSIPSSLTCSVARSRPRIRRRRGRWTRA
ncbi:DUF1707 domain-containing protein [Gordonia sp. NPDC003585]|uniref:DUF1707 domain-containing protein n=1 Tax=Gordonia sp. NPDC003585 TaxID=3154275 RepID=UPI0033AA7DC8